MERQKAQGGQVLPLTIASAMLSLVLLLQLHDTGRLAIDKQRLADAADAAAYSGLVWEARSRNLASQLSLASVAVEIAAVQNAALQVFSQPGHRRVTDRRLLPVAERDRSLLAKLQAQLMEPLGAERILPVVERIVRSKDPRFIVRDLRRIRPGDGAHRELHTRIGKTAAAQTGTGRRRTGGFLQVAVGLSSSAGQSMSHEQSDAPMLTTEPVESPLPESVGQAELYHEIPADLSKHAGEALGAYGPWWQSRLVRTDALERAIPDRIVQP